MSHHDAPRNTRYALMSLGSLCLFALSQGAAAVPLDDWATGATSAVFDCTSMTALECALGTDNRTDGPEGGGLMQASASSDISQAPTNARAYAELDPAAGVAVPVLKAEAYSGTTGGGAVAGAFAVEAYTNISGSDQSYTLDFFLDAMVWDPTTDNLLDQGTVVTGIGMVVTADSGLYSFDADFEAVIEDLLIQGLSHPTDVYATDLEALTAHPNDGSVQNLQTSLSFDLADGQSVYVLTLLSAQAMRDQSYADAYSTMTAQFRDTTGLVSQSNAGPADVPEPAPLGLVLLGTMLLLAGRRSR